jgi:hypothetical protein
MVVRHLRAVLYSTVRYPEVDEDCVTHLPGHGSLVHQQRDVLLSEVNKV